MMILFGNHEVNFEKKRKEGAQIEDGLDLKIRRRAQKGIDLKIRRHAQKVRNKGNKFK
jgi:hypothetical protein